MTIHAYAYLATAYARANRSSKQKGKNLNFTDVKVKQQNNLLEVLRISSDDISCRQLNYGAKTT